MLQLCGRPTIAWCCMLALNLHFKCREMWNYFTLPPASGNVWTAFKEVIISWWAALRNALQGRGFALPSQADKPKAHLSGHAIHHRHHHHRRKRHHEHPQEEELHWYVNPFCQYREGLYNSHDVCMKEVGQASVDLEICSSWQKGKRELIICV